MTVLEKYVTGRAKVPAFSLDVSTRVKPRGPRRVSTKRAMCTREAELLLGRRRDEVRTREGRREEYSRSVHATTCIPMYCLHFKGDSHSALLREEVNIP